MLPGLWRFHGFEISYFSAKVRPALRYKRLWVEEVRADVAEIRRRTGLAYIPILVTPEDETWQDSSDILDRLEAHQPDPPLFPATPVQRLAALLVELYADEIATIPAMHYRWGSPLGESTARARFTAMIGDAESARKAADRMSAGRLAVGASAEAGPAIEAHTRDLLAALCTHFSAHPFLLGGRLSLADCALMGPVHGHFFNDLVSRRLLLETAVPVVGWIERCLAPDPERQTAWLAGDALAPGLRAALTVMGRDGAPILLATVAAIEAWADAHRSEAPRPPRAVGACETVLRGTPLRRVAQTYTLWMVQRVLDAYRALGPADRAAVDAAFVGTGWEPVLALSPRHRLVRQGFELVFA